jgi:hypothetical protein
LTDARLREESDEELLQDSAEQKVMDIFFSHVDVWAEIFKYLDFADLLSLGSASRQCYRLAHRIPFKHTLIISQAPLTDAERVAKLWQNLRIIYSVPGHTMSQNTGLNCSKEDHKSLDALLNSVNKDREAPTLFGLSLTHCERIKSIAPAMSRLQSVKFLHCINLQDVSGLFGVPHVKLSGCSQLEKVDPLRCAQTLSLANW